MAILTHKAPGPKSVHYTKPIRKMIYAAEHAAHPKETSIRNIIESYRRRIKGVYPKAEFDTEFVLGATVLQFIEHIEAYLQPGMTWENYGRWIVCHRRNAADLGGLHTSDGFYKYFHYTNRVPRWKRGKGFVADPAAPSPLDRDADQV